MQEVFEETFEKEVLQSDIPVIVDWNAVWCGPCRALAPILKDLENDLTGTVKFVSIDTDTNGSLAQGFGIRSIPLVMLFKNGEMIRQWTGLRPKSFYTKELESLV